MNRKTRVITLAIGLLGFAIFTGTLTGDVQKVIKFASVDNEIAFASIVFVSSIFALILGLRSNKE